MSTRAIDRRLEALEERSGAHAPMYAVEYPDEAPGMVTLGNGTDECMSLAAFEQRYSNGTVIRVLYVDKDEV